MRSDQGVTDADASVLRAKEKLSQNQGKLCAVAHIPRPTDAETAVCGSLHSSGLSASRDARRSSSEGRANISDLHKAYAGLDRIRRSGPLASRRLFPSVHLWPVGARRAFLCV